MKYYFNKIFVCISLLIVNPLLWAQDIIITNSAYKIEAKILEVSKSEIKYKEKDNLDGPTFVISTDEINSIIYANGKVVLYNQTKTDEKEHEKATSQISPVSSTEQTSTNVINYNSEILLLSGDIIRGKLIELADSYVAYTLDGKYYTIPAPQVDKVTDLRNGNVTTYGGANRGNSAKTTQSTSPKNSSSGRIYRDNGEYLYNDTYISSKEVARILERENSTAYDKWKTAQGMMAGGAVCVSLGTGLAVGGLVSLIFKQYTACIVMDCIAIVPLGVGLGLTLGAKPKYNEAIDIYNSKHDHAAVQLRWSVAPTGIGLALAF